MESMFAETAPVAFQLRVDWLPMLTVSGDALKVTVGGAAALASCRFAPGTTPRQPAAKTMTGIRRARKTYCTKRGARNIVSPRKKVLSGYFESGTPVEVVL